jgi:hypothetical protein
LVDLGVRRIKVWNDEKKGEQADIANKIGELVTAMADIERLDVSDCQWVLSGQTLATAMQPTRLVALSRLNLARLGSTTGDCLKLMAAS